MKSLGYFCLVCFCLGMSSATMAVTLSLDDLALTEPAGETNRVALTVSAPLLGSDTQTPDLSGNLMADLDVNFGPTAAEVTGIGFTGGRINLSDVSFRLGNLFVSIDAVASGMSGTVSTPLPPGMVANNVFNAGEHTITVDEGVIVAEGEVIDFSDAPVEATADADGQITMQETGSVNQANGVERTYDIQLQLPISIDETNTVENVPLLGSIDVRIVGAGEMVASSQTTVFFPFGDFDYDTQLTCTDLDELTANVGSADPTYDLNGDGEVSSADIQHFVEVQAGTSLGDTNLDGAVDANDWSVIEGNLFTATAGHCQGDLNSDGAVDGRDFNIWNDNRTPVGAALASVPEPAHGWWLGFGMAVFLRRRLRS